MANPTDQSDIKAMSFEQALKELETIVDRLEKGDVELEASIVIYERGEALRAQGKLDEAQTLMNSALRDAEQWTVLPMIERCHTSLGLIAEAQGDDDGAERAFQAAIASIEGMRAPLPAEEFRTAFMANKLLPYTEMVRLCLAKGTPGRVAEARPYLEQAARAGGPTGAEAMKLLERSK